MTVAEIQFTPWDKAYWFDKAGLNLEVDNKVIVQTELGTEIGQVVGFQEVDQSELGDRQLKKINRKANLSDLEKATTKKEQGLKALKICRELIDKHALQMKLVDAHFSFDGGRITFAFIADGRVDFRELVKDLTHKFQKSIRMQQLGVRDEAKYLGQFGSCGRQLCCQKFLKNLGQVSSDFAATQQVMHRGGERLSGMCGRLKCCLKYEQELYEDLAKNLPSIGTRVRTDQGRGQIVSHKVLKQAVEVKLDGENNVVVEVAIDKSKS